MRQAFDVFRGELVGGRGRFRHGES
jgi:hypothetical protein